MITKFNYFLNDDSLLEGLDDFYYRFKTKEEFEKEFGDNWWTAVDWRRCDNAMNYLFGTKLEYEFPDDKHSIEIPNKTIGSLRRDWIIIRKMLVKVRKPPTYEPKKFDRTLD